MVPRLMRRRSDRSARRGEAWSLGQARNVMPVDSEKCSQAVASEQQIIDMVATSEEGLIGHCAQQGNSPKPTGSMIPIRGRLK